MKRFLMVLALGGAMFAGCGDDDGDDDEPRSDAGDGSIARPDSSVSDGGLDAARPDAGPDATVAAKVTNTGTACTTANAATTCTGSAAACLQTIGFGAAAPGGGYCSATCTASAQCGATGSCPFGDLLNGGIAELVRGGFLEAGVPNAALTAAQHCYTKCAAPGSQSTCASGYKCTMLKTEFSALAAAEGAGITSVAQGICIPTTGLAAVPAPVDAGVVGDAGRDAAVVQGMDSGL